MVHSAGNCRRTRPFVKTAEQKIVPRGSLECNPEIPAFPGEEYEVLDVYPNVHRTTVYNSQVMEAT